MTRFLCLLVTLVMVGAPGSSATAAEMTFQLVNDSDRVLSFKLFSRAESRQQWPAKTKAFAIKPDSAIQQIKITCEDGEQICWGAWVTVQSVSREIIGAAGERATHTSTHSRGAGERGQRTCESCCHICTDGALVPATMLHDPKPGAR